MSTTPNYQPGLSYKQYNAIGEESEILTLRASTLKPVTEIGGGWTPLHARHREQSEKQSDALSLGDALHKATLEPMAFDRDFDQHYVLFTETIGTATKAANECRLLHPEQILVTPGMLEQVKRMRQALFDHREIARLLEDCPCKELSGVAADPDMGVARKVRIDACGGVGNEGEAWTPYLLDIKTTRSIGSFHFEIRKFGYDIQSAFYIDTDALITKRRREAMMFAVVSNVPPYCARLYGISDEQLGTPDMPLSARATYLDRMTAYVQAHMDRQWCAWEHEEEPVPIFLQPKP